MTSETRTTVALSLALIGFSVIYQWHPQGPYYLPELHRWATTKVPGAIAMGWFGRSLWGALAALVTGGLGWWLAGRLAEPPRQARQALRVAALVALAALACAIVHHEFSHWGTWPYPAP